MANAKAARLQKAPPRTMFHARLRAAGSASKTNGGQICTLKRAVL